MKASEIEKIRWPEDKDKAKEIQARLREAVVLGPLKRPPAFVAGVDSAFFGDRIISVACLYEFPQLKQIEVSHIIREVSFPYIPGLLFFREGPAVIEAIKGLKQRPDLIIFDGQGIAHPRGLGIASSVGALIDVPSIGCAKSRLFGEYEEPANEKGSRSPLTHDGRVIGAVLRTQNKTRPVFVSPGHRIDVEGAVEYVMRCTGRYRLPEPVRMADRLSKKLKPKSDHSSPPRGEDLNT